MSVPTVSDFIREKAERLLVTGRVLIACGNDGLTATVEGDHGTYMLVREGDRFRCTCPARRTCAHAVAVERVTEKPGEPGSSVGGSGLSGC